MQPTMIVMSRLSFYSSFLLLLRFVVAEGKDSEELVGYNVATYVFMFFGFILYILIGCFAVWSYVLRCLKPDLHMDRSSDQGNRLNVDQVGLDSSVIETFPKFRYSTVKTLRIGGKEALECPVCLNEFKDDEMLRLIPRCHHVYHPGCIDVWLRSRTTCPLCRANLVPVPGESISIEIPGLARETGQNSPGTTMDENRIGSGNQSMPRSSMSTEWELAEVCSQSSLTDQTGENLDRFTLRLPQEMHDQLVNPNLENQGSIGQVALPQVRSSIQGYRNGSSRTVETISTSKGSTEDRFP